MVQTQLGHAYLRFKSGLCEPNQQPKLSDDWLTMLNLFKYLKKRYLCNKPKQNWKES